MPTRTLPLLDEAHSAGADPPVPKRMHNSDGHPCLTNGYAHGRVGVPYTGALKQTELSVGVWERPVSANGAAVGLSLPPR